jgi:flagellar basal body rod protein FlgG
VEQGYLETSNQPPAEAAARLILVMRQFEMLQRAIQIGSEMNRRADELARVGA